MYLYRAVDKSGKTVDFYLSRKRDVNAAKAFLRKAMKDQRIPAKINLDAYAASHRAVADLKENGELPKRVRVRTSKYLNNAIEQDHRRVKQRLRSMLGLKSFRTAAVVIGGIELAEKIKRDNLNSVSSAAARQRCQRSGKLPWRHNRDNSSITGKSDQIWLPLEIAPEPFQERHELESKLQRKLNLARVVDYVRD